MHQDEVTEIQNKILSIKKPIPMKIPYYFARLAEIIDAQGKELEELRNFKKQIELAQKVRKYQA